MLLRPSTERRACLPAMGKIPSRLFASWAPGLTCTVDLACACAKHASESHNLSIAVQERWAETHAKTALNGPTESLIHAENGH